jgi:hypothetical protein
MKLNIILKLGFAPRLYDNLYPFITNFILICSVISFRKHGQFPQLTLWNRCLYLMLFYSIGRGNCHSRSRVRSLRYTRESISWESENHARSPCERVSERYHLALIIRVLKFKNQETPEIKLHHTTLGQPPKL